MIYAKVLVDPQIDFVSGVFGTEEAQAVAGYWARFLAPSPAGGCGDIADVAADVGGSGGSDGSGDLFFVTRDAHPAPYAENPESGLFATPHCVAGTEGCEFVKPVADALSAQGQNPAYQVCEKNGFVCLDLPDRMRAAADVCRLSFGSGGQGLGIVMCGVVTDICVVANAVFLQAHFPWARISVDAAGCAGTTRANHEAALRVISSLGIGVANRESSNHGA